MLLPFQQNKMKIIPTILEKDFSKAEKKILLIKDKSRWMQIDVVDGTFNEGKSFELELLNKLASEIENNLIEIHLMVKEPIKWIEKCNFVGASRIIGQVEMMNDRQKFVDEVKNAGLEVGLAWDVDTEIGEIPGEVDLVLLMGRKSGFASAEFEERTLRKIGAMTKIREEMEMSWEIGVDGGVNEKNINKIKTAGATITYCGGAIFNGDIDNNLRLLYERIK